MSNTPSTTPAAAMFAIDKAAAAYADARQATDVIVTALTEALEAIKRDYLADMRAAVARAAEAHEKLKALLVEYPDQFVKPKTVVTHGLQIGYRQTSATVVVADEPHSVALVEKLMPELADALIVTEKKLIKQPLRSLTDEQLKLIGAYRTDAANEVTIKPVDGEVEKFVNKLGVAADS